MTPGLALQKWLTASYSYYILDETIMPDTAYDLIAQKLLLEWDTFDHPHKYLVAKDDLKAGTLYGIKESKYPRIIKGAALYEIERLKNERK